jgi:hypothetical protein
MRQTLAGRYQASITSNLDLVDRLWKSSHLSVWGADHRSRPETQARAALDEPEERVRIEQRVHRF